jgi:hypothetical protein
MFMEVYLRSFCNLHSVFTVVVEFDSFPFRIQRESQFREFITLISGRCNRVKHSRKRSKCENKYEVCSNVMCLVSYPWVCSVQSYNFFKPRSNSDILHLSLPWKG